MKRFFLLLIALLLVSPAAVHAQSQESMKIMPVPPDNSPGSLFGQNHYYTVTLRGNGEAVITFKAILSNNGTTPLEAVSLQLPENVMPSDLTAYQVKQEPQCIRYLPQPLLDTKSSTSVPQKETCAEYQRPDYQYVYGNTTYHRIQNQIQDNTVVLNLPLPIEPNSNGSYFVSLRTNTMVQKNPFGAYNYNFKTFKTEDKIHTLQVGIATDADYLLRGVKGDVNYASTIAMAAVPAADGMERGVSNAQFDQFYNQIGSGTLLKQASDLAANETYEVKGSYADSQAKLYGAEMTTGILITLILLIIAIFAIRISMRKIAKKKADKPEEAVINLKNQNKTFLIALSISFVSMLLVCLYTFGVYAITQLLNPNMYYSNDSMVLSLFIFAISGLVYLFCFFAPAVGMAAKRGLGWGLVTFSATVVWAVLFLLILFVVLFFFMPRNNGNQPYPLMGTFESRVAPAAAVDLAQPVEAPVTISEPQNVEIQEVQTQELKTQTFDVQAPPEGQGATTGDVMINSIEAKPAVRAL